MLTGGIQIYYSFFFSSPPLPGQFSFSKTPSNGLFFSSSSVRLPVDVSPISLHKLTYYTVSCCFLITDLFLMVSTCVKLEQCQSENLFCRANRLHREVVLVHSIDKGYVQLEHRRHSLSCIGIQYCYLTGIVLFPKRMSR